jgi:ComF family protein
LISLRYDEKSKLLIENYKYKWHKSLNNIFSEYLKKTFELLLDKENIKTKEIIITWTPLFFFDFLKRWYNHSYILAKNLNSDKHKFLRIFIKKRSTVPQAKLKKQERIRNLKNAFAIRKKYNQFIKWKTLLIVDDVISTWSTANNLAKLLKDSGAKKVYGLFLATWV